MKIFLAGTHRTAHSKKQWSESDVDTIVKNTLASSEEKIPFTAQTADKKHPRQNLPVYGYADKKSIRKFVENGVAGVEIQPMEFADGLLEAAKDFGLNNLSVRLDGADFSLEHICLVENPAVQNIPPISSYDFSAEPADAQWIDLSAGVDFADNRMWSVGRILRRLREYWIEKHGQEEADKALPDIDIDEMSQWKPEVPQWFTDALDSLRESVRALEEKVGLRKQLNTDPEFTHSTTLSEVEMKEIEELRATLTAQGETMKTMSADFSAFKEQSAKETEALKADNAAQAKELAVLRHEGRKREHADFVDAMIQEGRILPAAREGVLRNMGFLADADAGKVDFAAGEKPALEAWKDEMRTSPVVAPIGKTIATKQTAAAANSGKADFSMDTREDEIKLRDAARKLAAERNIDFNAALDILLDENGNEE